MCVCGCVCVLKDVELEEWQILSYYLIMQSSGKFVLRFFILAAKKLHLLDQPSDLLTLRLALSLQLVELIRALQVYYIIIAQFILILCIQFSGRIELCLVLFQAKCNV